MKRNRWLLIAAGSLAVVILAWVLVVVVINPAEARGLPFTFELQSRLRADYSSDDRRVVPVFRLSIIGEALQDLGLTSDEAQEQAEILQQSLDDPVPTATARNFEGELPYTATPTNTPTATPTPTDTPTPTPTSTPRPTRTPVPTATRTSAPPTSVPPTTAPSDGVSPVISGGNPNPPPGALTGCSVTINVTDINVVDPGPSSGIDWVKLKYRIVGHTTCLCSAELSLDAGGWVSGPGSTWDGTYSGSVAIDLCSAISAICPGGYGVRASVRAESTSATPSDYTIELWFVANDNAGNSTYHHYGDYTMPASCCP